MLEKNATFIPKQLQLEVLEADRKKLEAEVGRLNQSIGKLQQAIENKRNSLTGRRAAAGKAGLCR